MIRIFVLLGTGGVLLAAYLVLFAVGPISQLPPEESLLTEFRAQGYVPAEVNLEEDPATEESGAFEVPAQDAVTLAAAREAAGSMAGMDMSGGDSGAMTNSDGTTMNMGDTAAATMTNSDGTTMNMGDTAAATMTNSDGTTMNMGDTAAATMTNSDGTTMNMGDTAAATMTNSDGTTMNMGDTAAAGTMDMNGADAGMNMGEEGLLVTDSGAYDREIDLTMSEWEFSDMNIDVKVGERIKFVVKNGGQIPHEFMFMSMPLMEAVKYRETRADWNLVEHKALFEQPLVLPGGDFEFVLTVTEPGTWMFMCMLPYHMQMGMMGQMSTPGASMQM